MRALIRFGKERRLRFVSHLDLQRFFQRALNRTELPIAFSQGFNPHAVMSFASALAMGWTSEYEVLDVKLAGEVSVDQVETAMRRALPEDLPVYAVRLVEDRFPACMALVQAAEYEILPGAHTEALLAEIPGYLREKSVMGIRKTKSGERAIDIRPLTYRLERTDSGLLARLALTERDTLKPDVLVCSLAQRAKVDVPEIQVRRLCLLAGDAGGSLVPLMERRA